MQASFRKHSTSASSSSHPKAHAPVSESLLRSIVHWSQDAIVTKDLDGLITSWNPSAESLFGYQPEEIIGKSIFMLIPEELRDGEKVILERVESGSRIPYYETTRLRKGGEHIQVSIAISPLRDASGSIIGASKLIRDISETKRMQQRSIEAEKFAISGRMAMSLAHEINNPLEAAVNLVFLARTNLPDMEQVVEYLQSAESELERLAFITRQVLGFYQDSAPASPSSLSTLVQSALVVYAKKIAASGIVLKAVLSSTRSLDLKQGEVSHVVSQLLANSMAAMPSGGILLITVRDVDTPHSGVLMEVKDDGPGIPADDLERIFEPFVTGSASKGVGIGLWISKKLIEAQGGRITITTNTDPVAHGTTVSVFLSRTRTAGGC